MIGEKDGKRQLVSIDLNGEAQRVHAEGELVNDYAISPDGRHVAFRQNYEVFVMPLMPGGAGGRRRRPRKAPLPVTRVSDDRRRLHPLVANGAQLHWSLGADALHGASNRLFADRAAGRGRAQVQPPTTGVSLAMDVAAGQADRRPSR